MSELAWKDNKAVGTTPDGKCWEFSIIQCEHGVSGVSVLTNYASYGFKMFGHSTIEQAEKYCQLWFNKCCEPKPEIVEDEIRYCTCCGQEI